MNDLVYVVEMTLTPPTADGKVTVVLKLSPTDPVTLLDGRAKPLSECTVAELTAYADSLEQEIDETWQQLTLPALQDRSEVDVQIDGIADSADWRHQIILLPKQEQKQEVVIAPVEEEIEVIVQSADSHSSEQPLLNVSDAQPVHEERVASADPTETIKIATNIRTAGSTNGTRHNNIVDILLDEPPLRRMQSHALSSMHREVAGVMVGPIPEKQPNGLYVVHITDMIEAKYTRMSGASVTYTPESWRYLNDVLAERYPEGDKVMVGWYHTHPGFGIFLSNMDLFIHTNFFTQKWHIAYVLDPVARRSGFFSWDTQHSRVLPYHLPWPEWAQPSW